MSEKKFLKSAEVYKPNISYGSYGQGRNAKKLSIFIAEMQRMVEQYPDAELVFMLDDENSWKIVADRFETDSEYELRVAREAQDEAYHKKRLEDQEKRDFETYLKLKEKYEKK
jgi:hypothetical protein